MRNQRVFLPMTAFLFWLTCLLAPSFAHAQYGPIPSRDIWIECKRKSNQDNFYLEMRNRFGGRTLDTWLSYDGPNGDEFYTGSAFYYPRSGYYRFVRFQLSFGGMLTIDLNFDNYMRWNWNYDAQVILPRYDDGRRITDLYCTRIL